MRDYQCEHCTQAFESRDAMDAHSVERHPGLGMHGRGERMQTTTGTQGAAGAQESLSDRPGPTGMPAGYQESAPGEDRRYGLQGVQGEAVAGSQGMEGSHPAGVIGGS
jgi:hypothetical protein